MGFDKIEKKIMRPPAAHNVARLLDPSSEIRTVQNIARFAISIPAFNYVGAMKICKDRVSLSLDRETALKAVESSGAPAGREQNARFVRAFYEYDEHRKFSDLKTVDSYPGQFLISRDIRVPMAPTFTIIENAKQVPVVVCGWAKFVLTNDQIRAWVTMLESGLFSFADYRNSPCEILLLPEIQKGDELRRMPLVIHRGDHALFSNSEMRDLAAMYARAQKAAMPIAREMWEANKLKRKEIFNETNHHRPDDGNQRDLFRKD